MSSKPFPSMLDAGFGNSVPRHRIVGVVGYDSEPVRNFVDELYKLHRVIDATRGRKTKSVVFLDSSHVVLSAVARETLCERLEVGFPENFGSQQS
jgi:regulator of extracellular matrix RemA (YlzA/DUF370 family)